MRIFFLAAFISVFTPRLSNAQKPSAIVVMLKAERNRVTAFKKTGETQKLAQLSSEAAIVQEKTINDFTDHFDYCPVYYFIDTNLHLVKQKKLDGIFFDKDRKVYKVSPIDVSDTSFYIVMYGYKIPPIEERNGEKIYIAPSTGKNFNKGLSILDHQFYKIRYLSTSFLHKREPKHYVNNTYEFVSTDFSVSYMLSAGRLQSIIEHQK